MSIITGFGDDDVGACAHANKQVDNPSENDFLSYIFQGIYCVLLPLIIITAN